MADKPSSTKQVATGSAIAQATSGATASVSIGYSAEEVTTLLSTLLAGTQGLPVGASMVLGPPQITMEAPRRPDVVLRRYLLVGRVEETLAIGKAVVLQGDAGS